MCFIIGCNNSEKIKELEEYRLQIKVENQNKEIVKRWLTKVNKDNYKTLLSELWSEDCMHYFNSDSNYLNFDQFLKLCERLYTEMPVIEHKIYKLLADRNYVTAYFSAHVTHDVKSFGMLPTGEELNWKAMTLFELSNNKIVKRWEVTDLLGLYTQLGKEIK